MDGLTTINTGTVTDAVLSPDGASLYVARGGTIYDYNSTSGALLNQWQIGTKLQGIDLSPDGRTLLATELAPGASTPASNFSNDVQWSVYRLDLTSGATRTYTNTVNSSVASDYHDVAYLSDGTALLTQDYNGSGFTPLTILDLGSGSFTASKQNYAQDGTLTTTRDHSKVMFSPSNISDQPVFIYQAGVGVVASHQNYQDNISGYNNGVQAFAPDGSLALEGPGLPLYDGSLHFLQKLSSSYPVSAAGVAFDPSGQHLFVLDATTKELLELETTHFGLVAGYSIPDVAGPQSALTQSFGNSLQVSPDGNHVTIIGANSIQLLDLTRATSNQGTAGADVLIGRSGDDLLYGLGGDDRIIGNGGSDQLTGGAGADTFVFTGGTSTYAQVRDFSLTDGDRIELVNVPGIHSAADALAKLQDQGLSSSLSLPSGYVTLPGVVGQSVDASSFVVKNTATDDYTGDGHSDILWQNTNGAVSAWTVAGNDRADQVMQSTYNTGVATSWHAMAGFDMDGDGRADMLWRNDDGSLAVWRATGDGFAQSFYYHGPVDTAWRVAGTGDFTGDGKADLLWQNQNGSISTWTSTGTGFVEASYSHDSPGAGWRVEGFGDFNGDGKADILWRNDDGAVSTWASTGSGFQEGSFYAPGVPTSWHIVGVGDFSGDGRDDILWRNDNGALSVWRSNGAGFDRGIADTVVSTDWHVAAVGDYNDDGKADILWQNSNGAISTWQSNGSGFDQNVYSSGVPAGWHVIPGSVVG